MISNKLLIHTTAEVNIAFRNDEFGTTLWIGQHRYRYSYLIANMNDWRQRVVIKSSYRNVSVSGIHALSIYDVGTWSLSPHFLRWWGKSNFEKTWGSGNERMFQHWTAFRACRHCTSTITVRFQRAAITWNILLGISDDTECKAFILVWTSEPFRESEKSEEQWKCCFVCFSEVSHLGYCEHMTGCELEYRQFYVKGA